MMKRVCMKAWMHIMGLAAFRHDCLSQDANTHADGNKEDNADDGNDKYLHWDSCNCFSWHETDERSLSLELRLHLYTFLPLRIENQDVDVLDDVVSISVNKSDLFPSFGGFTLSTGK